MDMKKFATILLILGCVVTLSAVGWWAHFYSGLTDKYQGDLSDAVDCLYSNKGICRAVTGVAEMLGKTPYNPIVFWIGAGVLGGGLIIRLSLK